MNPGEFIFAGINSRQFGVLYQIRPDRVTPVRRFGLATPSNRNGTVYHDTQKYDNKALSLECFFVDKPSQNQLDAVTEWLDSSDYQDLQLYYDNGFTYRAIVSDAITFSSIGAYHEVFVFSIPLTILPFKYLTSGLTQLDIGTGASISNPTKYPAYPKIVLSGSGSITLTVNGVVYSFTALSTPITIDSEVPSTDQPTNMVGMDYPVLNPGSNTISTTGTDIKIIPRYVRRAV